MTETPGRFIWISIPIEERFIVNRLVDVERRDVYSYTDQTTYHQMSLFDDFKLGVAN